MEYHDFLKSKQDYGARHGFEPVSMPSFLFDFQTDLVEWATRLGRAAIFADCGMGKTPMQLVWAQNVVQHTNKPVLILTPLAVSAQTLDEAEKFGIAAQRADPDTTPKPGVHVINYERLHYFDARDYAGVVCDESSILKNDQGVRRGQITEFMRVVPYRLLATATAAPNDWEELGTSSEALGYLGHQDMLNKFFTNKAKSGALRKFQSARDKWYLRSYAADGPFWRWVTSWARAARKPSDLGYPDNGFILPELIERDTQVSATCPPDGMLFELPAVTFHEERDARKRSIAERCEAAAQRVESHDVSVLWCNRNDEGDLLEKLVPDSVQVSGSDSDERKEEVARWFSKGTETRRRIITKPTIFGFGMNWQHCHHMTYFPMHSYEQYYQATRRIWRFGQEHSVIVDRIYSDGGKRVLENMERKAEAADEMFSYLVEYMREGHVVENVYHSQNVEVPQWLSK